MDILNSEINFIIVLYSLNVVFLGLNLFFYFKSQHERKMLNDKIKILSEKELDITHEANEKVKTILTKALDKARKTLVETKYLRKELIEDLEKGLKEVVLKESAELEQDSQNLQENYQKLFDKYKNEYVKKADQAIESMDSAAKSHLEGLEANLENKIFSTEENFDKQVEEELARVKKVIEEYKNFQLRQIDEVTNKIVLQISEEVIGKAISSYDHQKLVLEALEKAKKEHLFDS